MKTPRILGDGMCKKAWGGKEGAVEKGVQKTYPWENTEIDSNMGPEGEEEESGLSTHYKQQKEVNKEETHDAKGEKELQ